MLNLVFGAGGAVPPPDPPVTTLHIELIPQPFFELQTPDFAWKFVWIFRKNYKSKEVQKVHKYS